MESLCEELKKTDYTTEKLRALYEKDTLFYDLYVHLEKMSSIYLRRMNFAFPDAYGVDEEDWPEEWHRLIEFDVLIGQTNSMFFSESLRLDDKMASVMNLFSKHPLYDESLLQAPCPTVFYEDDNKTPRTGVDRFEEFETVILSKFKQFLEYIYYAIKQ